MPNIASITPEDVSGMVTHWLGCPPGGYLGSDYGADVKAILQTPMAGGLADELIAQSRRDIPILGQAPAGAINLYSYDEAIDRKVIVLDVVGQLVSVGA